MRRNTVICVIALTLALESAPADLLDQLNDTLSIRDSQNRFQLQLSGLIDFKGYFIDQRQPGLISTKDSFLFNPRVSFFLDAQFTKHFYLFDQSRLDRGFDPSDRGAQVRLDEYFLRYTPLDDPRVNFQLGKFATVIGNWLPRHESWQNPLHNATLTEENTSPVSDREPP